MEKLRSAAALTWKTPHCCSDKEIPSSNGSYVIVSGASHDKKVILVPVSEQDDSGLARN